MYANLARIARDYGMGQDRDAVHPQKPGISIYSCISIKLISYCLDWVSGVEIPSLELKNLGMINVASAAE